MARPSLRGRRLKGKGKGVLGARETRGAPLAFLSRLKLPFPKLPFKRLPRRLGQAKPRHTIPRYTIITIYEVPTVGFQLTTSTMYRVVT